MNYEEFKAHLMTYLWRDGDAVLAANMDNLIQMADSELNTSLNIQEREMTVQDMATGPTVLLPTDYFKMRSVHLLQTGEATYVTPPDLYDLQEKARELQPFYTLASTTNIIFAVPDNVDYDYRLIYRAKVPDFKTTDTSWVADNYLAMYTNCVLKQSAPFLREDDRLQIWKAMYDEQLAKINDDDAWYKATGVGATEPLPRQASAPRYRNWRGQL